KPAAFPRVADTQKCLRVSGKHNDLEEVGRDTYHHTMFEMLGNWSFGDYFKKQAIAWAWELLTEVYGIPREDLYVTVFGGDQGDGLPMDREAYELWKAIVPEAQILSGSKKDNFWEMGDTGPCGPCSEIHIDIRDDQEKAAFPGRELVNKDHPQVIEIWNLVFMEFNRMADGSLRPLPAKHVDTGMGFERLCMVLQHKQSNYDTDVFTPLITRISEMADVSYGANEAQDIAMRVIADHCRAISFAIADGQLPSNTGAGYVIRRILRRAVRYAYTFLGQKDPALYRLVEVLEVQFREVFPELSKQKEIIEKVIKEEETSFLRTLANGIQRFNQYLEQHKEEDVIDGVFAFELFDTYGFPFDLTALMAEENHKRVDEEAFKRGLQAQKERSRKAAAVDTDDWVVLKEPEESNVQGFVGYDHTELAVHVMRYRKITSKNKTTYQLVFDATPFYAESGGQVGDTGFLEAVDGTRITIVDTKKENDLIVHLAKKLPETLEGAFRAVVDAPRREAIMRNHSATHLLHHALRSVLGTHVEQKGSFVGPDYLRFDFSHFGKMSEEEMRKVEQKVNAEIRRNLPLTERRAVPMKEAEAMGAMALFGEKYGDQVRVIKFGDSVELCGGTHVAATGNIGVVKIVSEGAIAAGVRRIEAITGEKAEAYLDQLADVVSQAKGLLKNQKDVVKGIEMLLATNHALQKELEVLKREKAAQFKRTLLSEVVDTGKYNLLIKEVDLDAATMKDLAFQLKGELSNYVIVLGTKAEGKAGLLVMIDEAIAKGYDLHAGTLVRELAKAINGGGGGQPHFASAGGKKPEGVPEALQKAEEMLA
ncbi:MAG: alanine--tRNA ligase, partial [Bacteroidetes bacterium]